MLQSCRIRGFEPVIGRRIISRTRKRRLMVLHKARERQNRRHVDKKVYYLVIEHTSACWLRSTTTLPMVPCPKTGRQCHPKGRLKRHEQTTSCVLGDPDSHIRRASQEPSCRPADLLSPRVESFNLSTAIFWDSGHRIPEPAST